MMELTGRGRGRGHLCHCPGVSLPLFLEPFLVLSRRRQRPPQLLPPARRPYLLCAQGEAPLGGTTRAAMYMVAKVGGYFVLFDDILNLVIRVIDL